MSMCWRGESHKQKSQVILELLFEQWGIEMGGNTHIQVEVFLSAHSFQLCQNPWPICQGNNPESVPKEHQIQMSENVFKCWTNEIDLKGTFFHFL